MILPQPILNTIQSARRGLPRAQSSFNLAQDDPEPVEGSRGFTLLELLVSIALIALMLGFLIPGFSYFDRINKIDRAAHNLRATILETKNYALAPRTQAVNVDSYIIKFNQPTPGQYGIYEHGISGVENNVKTFSLPTGLTFSALPTPAEIKYSIAEQGRIINFPDPAITIGISNSSGNSKNIVVQKETGQVEIQ